MTKKVSINSRLVRYSNILFDVIKNMPDYILDKDEKIDLYMECIVNHDLGSEESKYVIVPFPNPFLA